LKSLARWFALILLLPSLLFAKTPVADPAIYGPQPTWKEISSVLQPPSISESLLAALLHADAVHVLASGGAVKPWCYPNHAGTYCGWLATFVYDIDIVSTSPVKTRVNLPSYEVSIFFRDGKPLAWQGAISDDRVSSPLKFSFTAIKSDGKADAVAVDVFHPQFLFVNDKTGAIVEVKQGVAAAFKGWRRTFYSEYSLQYGFFLFVALEEAGFHRVDKADRPPDYVIDNTMQDIKTPTFGTSLPATVFSSVSIFKGNILVSKKDISATEVAKFKVDIYRGVGAMNAAMADVAELTVQYFKDAIVAVPAQ
jgi:hypothetical protein